MRDTAGRPAVMITRRTVLTGLGALGIAGSGGAAYAVGFEPMRLTVTRYRIHPIAPWPRDLSLRVVALSDIHACEPWMSASRIAGIVETANGLQGDVTVLLGDYVAGIRRFVTRFVDAAEWAPVLARLSAPLGTYAILGNHDWWEDKTAQARGAGPTIAGEALTRVGIRVLENESLPLTVRGHTVWLAGLGDQIAFLTNRRWRQRGLGVDDLDATLATIPDNAPAILLAHEPDIFPRVPARIALTLSGHTHGGQINLFGFVPTVPSRYGKRFRYGHVREQADLVVSGGLGMSIAPVRIGVPPEIVVVDLVGQDVGEAIG